MAAKFQIGQAVQQIVVPIAGNVKERRIVGDDDVFLVAWVDAEGNDQETFFKENELEAL